MSVRFLKEKNRAIDLQVEFVIESLCCDRENSIPFQNCQSGLFEDLKCNVNGRSIDQSQV